MRRYLLDTGPAQHLINRRRGVLDRVDEERHLGNRIGICVPVLGELWSGVEGRPPRCSTQVVNVRPPPRRLARQERKV